MEDQEKLSEALKYFTHVTKAYENLYDDHKRAIYDEESISDEDFFTIKLGPVKINMFIVFFASLFGSVGYITIIKYNILGLVKKDQACPIDHDNRLEMVKIARQ